MGIFLFLLPLAGYGQGCDNKVTIEAGGIGVRSRPNTINETIFDYCPDGTNTIFISGSTSTPDSRLTWTATSNGVSVPVQFTTRTDNRGTYSDITVSPSAATTYTLTSVNGCKPAEVAAQSISIAPSLSITSSSGSFICAGTSTVLTATGSTTNQYTWSAPGMPTVVTDGTLVVNPSVTTTYTVSTPSSGTCGAASQTLTVNVNGVTISPVAPVVCPGQPVTLTATYTGTAPTSYRWYNTANPGATLATTAVGQYVASPTATTTYGVEINTTDCGVFNSQATVVVGGATAATVTVTPSSATVCSGGNATFVASSNNAQTTFAWREKGRTQVLSDLAEFTTGRLNSTTTFELLYTTCGQTLTRDVVATVVSPVSSVSPSAVTICAGSRTTLSAVTNISNATFRWYVGSTATPAVSANPTLNVAPTATTTYILQVTTTCGTTNYSSTVTVNSAVTAPPSQTIVRGSGVTLTASGSSGGYAWTATAGGLATPAGNTASIMVSPLTTTTYTVTGTNATGCNTASTTVSVVAPLPVELVSFEAVRSGKTALLTWVTASEKNSAYFAIERSLDGKSFRMVGQRKGAGSTSARTTYDFVDADPAATNATAYYRLRQVDTDGTTAYSPVRTLLAGAGSRAFQASVLPNPYDKAVTVQFNAIGKGAAVLTVRNVLGQTVLTKTVSTTGGVQEVDLSETGNLPRGLYYLTIGQGNQREVVRMSHQ